MKTKLLLTSPMLLCIVSVFGQKLSVDIAFTGINNAAYTQLDSIKIMNRTQGDSAKLYWPDTTLTYEITPGDLMLYIGYSDGNPAGVHEFYQNKNQFQLFQNYPNPVKDQSNISMYIPEKGTVNIMITDIQGRVVIAIDLQLDKGSHSFRFYPGGSDLFLITAWWNGISRSIKILTTGSIPGKKCMLNYTGSGNGEAPLKEASLKNNLVMQESGILDTTVTNETYTFQFVTNIPCPGTPTVTYEGQVYNTIQIFSQCWLKENLNVGTMIQDQTMSDNGIIEKYCYDNDSINCDSLGGLYRWEEMMQYTMQQGTRGICPPDWHLPMDEEWKVLEGAVDSLYGIGDVIWDTYNYRGFDAGPNLKTEIGWYYEGNGTDLFGFSGQPGGHCLPSCTFLYKGNIGVWWTSTENYPGQSWCRMMNYADAGVDRAAQGQYFSHSVRCVRNE